MGRKTRVYSRVSEASGMIAKICEKHPKAFWAVTPASIAVMGVDNIERTEKAVAKQPVWSRMRNVKGVEQAIFQENNIQERYIIEVFWSDWNKWSDATRAAVLASHLFEITPDVETKNSADCSGFKILYKALGVNWERETSVPNILSDGFEFDLDLRPGLAELEAMDEGDDPDDI